MLVKREETGVELGSLEVVRSESKFIGELLIVHDLVIIAYCLGRNRALE